jgi:hypothetical protein
MASTSLLRRATSTETSAGFSQLPLSRERGRNGLLARNSTFTDRRRRSIVKRLPQGAPARIADRLGVDVQQVYDAHAAETRYTLDLFVAGLLEVPRDAARRILRPIARLVDALVVEDPTSCSDDSGVGL